MLEEKMLEGDLIRIKGVVVGGQVERGDFDQLTDRPTD